jgi:hypothetical protein
MLGKAKEGNAMMKARAWVSACAMLLAGCSADTAPLPVADGGARDASVQPHRDVGADAGNDSSTDAGQDVALAMDAVDADDAGDAAGANAAAVAAFLQQAVQAWCGALQQCCVAAPGTWDEARCEARLGPSGLLAGMGNVNLAAPLAQRGNIAVDPSQSQACLADLAAFPCATKTSGYWLGANLDCSRALAGQVPLGAYCAGLWECAGDATCRGNVCVALSGSGGACFATLNTDCEPRGFGPQGLWCSPEAGATCVPTLPDDAGCPLQTACQSGICQLGTCVESVAASSCKVFVDAPDAGP